MGELSPGAPPADQPAADRLDSWKEIAAYLERDVTTVQRWEKREAMPVHRHLHDKLGSVYASKAELDAWVRRRRPRLEPEEEGSDAGTLAAAPVVGLPAAPIAASRRWWVLGVMGLFVVLALSYLLIPFRPKEAVNAKITSLAVLPLKNLSGDASQDYLADGMTEAVIGRLAQIRGLRVISRTSVMRLKDTQQSVPEIGKALRVDAIVEGSVIREGSRIRVYAQLIRAATDEHFWAEAYDREFRDVLTLQSDLAQTIAQQIQMLLTPQQQARFRSGAAVNPRAYEAYLKGRFYETATTEVAIKRAIDYFEEAVREDPKFAPAYAGLGDCYLDLGAFRWLPPHDAYRHGSEAVNKALQLDETVGEAHSTLGYLDWQYSWDWQAADRELRKAVELSPSYVEGYETLVWYFAWSGRRDEALAEVERIRQLDPAYPRQFLDESGIHYHQRDYQSLLEASQKAVATDPEEPTGHYFLAVGYEGSGRFAEAVPEYQRAVDLSQRNTDEIAGLAHAYAAVGKPSEARKILGELQRQSKTGYVSPYIIATIYAGLGERDKAFEFLEKAYQEKSPDVAYFLKTDLRIDSLRSDLRFQDILRRMNFPE